MSDVRLYRSPLVSRYSSNRMQQLWGPTRRGQLWRQIWLALAEEQRKLGVEIPDEAIEELRAHQNDIDLDKVHAYESELRHDVMAHIRALGDVAPKARAYIHLGATSAFVTDNADLMVIREALRIVLGRLVQCLEALAGFAAQWRDTPTVAYTHYQPAQLTTVGKRATLWLQDLALDARAIDRFMAELPARGCKGTTGTQASYLELLGDFERVKELDQRVASRLGFARSIPVSGQTYTRKLDSTLLDLLAGVAQTASKIGNDLRLLQHEGEVFEPFETGQVGSSAMPYKRNPMRAERICSLARYVMSLRESTGHTMATQWFERTLDDSANRRLVLPDSFLAIDAILILLVNVSSGLDVRPATVARNVREVMPFMATERWLMAGVKHGGDRQTLHNVIRRHAIEVKDAVERGEPNNLVDRLAQDPAFAGLDGNTMKEQLEPSLYVGAAPLQVDAFLANEIGPLLKDLRSFRFEDDAAVTV